MSLTLSHHNMTQLLPCNDPDTHAAANTKKILEVVGGGTWKGYFLEKKRNFIEKGTFPKGIYNTNKMTRIVNKDVSNKSLKSRFYEKENSLAPLDDTEEAQNHIHWAAST